MGGIQAATTLNSVGRKPGNPYLARPATNGEPREMTAHREPRPTRLPHGESPSREQCAINNSTQSSLNPYTTARPNGCCFLGEPASSRARPTRLLRQPKPQSGQSAASTQHTALFCKCTQTTRRSRPPGVPMPGRVHLHHGVRQHPGGTRMEHDVRWLRRDRRDLSVLRLRALHDTRACGGMAAAYAQSGLRNLASAPAQFIPGAAHARAHLHADPQRHRGHIGQAEAVRSQRSSG